MQPDATGLLQPEGLKRIVGLFDFAAPTQRLEASDRSCSSALRNAAVERVRLGVRTR